MTALSRAAMPNDGQMMRRARLRSSVVAACRDEQLSATTEPTQDNIVFDRWVIDTKSFGTTNVKVRMSFGM